MSKRLITVLIVKVLNVYLLQDQLFLVVLKSIHIGTTCGHYIIFIGDLS